MKTAVLLGAGASRDAGVPLTTHMTEEIYNLTSPERLMHPDGDRLKRALGTVIGGLTYQKGIRAENPYQGLNVEEVFASVQMLANRNNIEAAPFIGSWHSAIEELDEEPVAASQYDELYRAIRNSLAEDLRKAVKGIASPLGGRLIQRQYERQSESKNPKYEWDRWIGDVLGDAFRKLENTRPSYRSKRNVRRGLGGVVRGNPNSGRGRVFRLLSDHMILSLRSLTWLDEGRDVSYLKPLLEIGTRPLSIYSLNYDNAIERLCQQNGVSYDIGVTQSGAVSFDSTSEVRLMKLHGSIDWIEQELVTSPDTSIAEPMSLMGVALATSEQMRDEDELFRPAIIFGQGNKLTAEGPYLELLGLFRNDLEQHDHLLVIGYSFRDDHINHYIARWFLRRPERCVTILNGKEFPQEAEGTPFTRDLLLSSGNRVTILPEYATDGLPAAVASSNGEGGRGNP